MTAPDADLDDHVLDDGHHSHVGRLPESLRPDAAGFEALWSLHPDRYHVIRMHGRPVETPRWQQAYGVDDHDTGRTNAALPVPHELDPFQDWARRAIDDRLHGLLVNWYDGDLGHCIGPHRDSVKERVRGAPIVTISLGEQRVFRLTHPGRRLTCDFRAKAGTVFVMPYGTKLTGKHAVPRSARHGGRRISLTLRALQESARRRGRPWRSDETHSAV
jgi:alkylated DNA repair dioxygenase AlkB